MLHPVGIDLGLHIARICLVKEKSPCPLFSPSELEEFETVVVVAEGQPGRVQPLADVICDLGETPESVLAFAVLFSGMPPIAT